MSEKTRTLIALISLIIIALLICGLFFIPIPDNAKDLINIALGFIAGYCGSVFNYYFGSSDGSTKKTALLNEREQPATGKPDDHIHVEPNPPTEDSPPLELTNDSPLTPNQSTNSPK